jgi:hypothetical protein
MKGKETLLYALVVLVLWVASYPSYKAIRRLAWGNVGVPLRSELVRRLKTCNPAAKVPDDLKKLNDTVFDCEQEQKRTRNTV